MKNSRTPVTQKTAFHIAVVLVLGFLAYSNTFGVPFVFDDEIFAESAMYKNISNVPSMFTEFNGRWASRPLLHATLALNYYFGGLDTRVYHATNLALHLLNGVLLYLLVAMTGRRLGYDRKEVGLAAVLSSLFFAVHPIQTEAVTYIISRSMLLSTVFYLSGLVLFLKSVTSEKRKGLYLAGLFLTTLMGVSSRENFATFPIMLFLYDMLFLSGLDLKRVRKHWPAYVPVLLAFVYFLYIVLNHNYNKYGGYGKGIPPLDYVYTQFNAHWTYLKLLALPINQNLDYDYPVARTLFQLRTLLSVAGYAGMLGLSAFYVRRNPVMSFGLSWFLIALAPVSFIVALMNVSLGDVVFEHRLYLPSVGPIVLIAALLVRLSKSPRLGNAVVPAALVLVLALGTATYERNTVWSDGITLWSDVIEKSPRKARGYNNAAMYYRQAGRPDSAIDYLEKALAITPGIAESHYNLGNAYGDKEYYEKAIEHYLKTIEINPTFIKAHVNLGILYRKLGLMDKATEHLEWAVRLRPDAPEPYYNLANAYLEQGRLDEAISNYEKAITISPDHASAHNNLAVAYRAKGLYSKAQEHFRIAERLKQQSRAGR